VQKVVFDCNIFAQALMNPVGPAGACVQAALNGQITLFIAEFVLVELRDIPNKSTPVRAGVTSEKTENLVQLLLLRTEFIPNIPKVFVHPIDEDDSDYVNLALAADANSIVSRDRHMLNLNNPAKAWSTDFRSRFPELRIISPMQLLTDLRASRGH
jgi:putative PIN family toxin of toxin-antitoxin system